MKLRFLLTILPLGIAGCADARTGGTESAGARAPADSVAVATPFHSGYLVIEDIVSPRPVPAGQGAPPAAVYFTVRNAGTRTDTLVSVEIEGATATLHQQTGGGGMESMVPLTFAVIPAGESIRFAPGGRHVMLEGLARQPGIGEIIPMTMIFARAGRVAVGARVVTYGDLEHVLSPGDEHAGH